VLKTSEFLDKIAGIYYANLQTLFEEEAAIELRTEYTWKGQIWELHPPELKHGDKMAFGEFIDSKQLVKDLHDLGQNKWQIMLRLAAIYLRKQGEAYEESFLYDDSERLKLMRDLPMDIALSVGFFLNSSLNFSLNRLMYLSRVEVNPDGSLQSISIGTVGSTSLNPLPKQKSLISRLREKIQLSVRGKQGSLMS
jgi:hypothetical protein